MTKDPKTNGIASRVAKRRQKELKVQIKQERAPTPSQRHHRKIALKYQIRDKSGKPTGQFEQWHSGMGIAAATYRRTIAWIRTGYDERKKRDSPVTVEQHDILTTFKKLGYNATTKEVQEACRQFHTIKAIGRILAAKNFSPK